MAITLLQLRTQSRQRADMENSTFVTDSELNSYINNSIAELHDILIQAYDGDYFVKTAEFSTVSTQELYSLSTIITDDDFYKLRGLDAKINGTDWFTVSPFNFNERNRLQNFGAWNYLGITNVRYDLVGASLRLTPVPDSNITIKVWYVPVSATLALDADTLDDLNHYSEYVVVDAAIKMAQKEESDVSVLMAQKDRLKRRIEEAANNRDAGAGDSVYDVYAENDGYPYGQNQS